MIESKPPPLPRKKTDNNNFESLRKRGKKSLVPEIAPGQSTKFGRGVGAFDRGDQARLQRPTVDRKEFAQGQQAVDSHD